MAGTLLPVVTDPPTQAAQVSADAAAASEAAAAASAASALSSETSAASSANNAATSEVNSLASEANAASSATAAATSETNAASSETGAATSATNAASSETNAATSETNAATSEANAAASATSAATSATDAVNTLSVAATTVLDLAELRATTAVSGKLVILKQHTNPLDGGGGVFNAVAGAAAGTYVDNNGTIIVPTGGDGSAAWLREYNGAADVEWFGYSEVDSYASIQAAFDSGIRSIKFKADKTYLVGQPLRLPNGTLIFSEGEGQNSARVHTTSGFTGDAVIHNYESNALIGTGTPGARYNYIKGVSFAYLGVDNPNASVVWLTGLYEGSTLEGITLGNSATVKHLLRVEGNAGVTGSGGNVRIGNIITGYTTGLVTDELIYISSDTGINAGGAWNILYKGSSAGRSAVAALVTIKISSGYGKLDGVHIERTVGGGIPSLDIYPSGGATLEVENVDISSTYIAGASGSRVGIRVNTLGTYADSSSFKVSNIAFKMGGDTAGHDTPIVWNNSSGSINYGDTSLLTLDSFSRNELLIGSVNSVSALGRAFNIRKVDSTYHYSRDVGNVVAGQVIDISPPSFPYDLTNIWGTGYSSVMMELAISGRLSAVSTAHHAQKVIITKAYSGVTITPMFTAIRASDCVVSISGSKVILTIGSTYDLADFGYSLVLTVK